MGIEILGISGSPIRDSNTDRLIKAMLYASGLRSEFVKLSEINVKPCFGCKKCVSDNICKMKDDFPKLGEKIKSAQALIIGSYTPYGQISAFTKALLERFWSFRHVNSLLSGKLCATVLTGLDPSVLDTVNTYLAKVLRDYEHMELVGQITVQGNMPCIFCGNGETCAQSVFRQMYGPDAKTSDFGYARVENQKEVWQEAMQLSNQIGNRLQQSKYTI